MAINFPNSPNLNDSHTVGDVTWTWNGSSWTAVRSTVGAESNDLSSNVTWSNVPDTNITQSSVVQHQAALSITESQISDLQSYLTSETSHADVLVDGDFASAGIMSTDGSGSYTILTDNSANWNTAYSWGDHSTAGYLTSVPAQSFASLTGKPTTIAGYGIIDAFDGDYNNLSNKPTIPSAYTNTDVDTHLNQSNPTSGYVLSWNGSDYAWVAQSGGITDTDSLSEGTTNLYYTDTRADARITAAGVTTTKVSNWDTAYGWGDHGSAGYLTSVPAQSFASLTGKPTTIAGYGITDAIELSNFSVNTNVASGGGSLSYNNSTGAFTYTPPDLSGYSTFDGDYNNLTNKPTIPSAYTNSDVDAHLNQSNPTAGYVLTWNGSDYSWTVNGTGSGLGDIVDDTTPQLGGNLDGQSYNITTTGKILYSNVYNTTGDLPSASTYHGMFAHVHATGKGYFAHGGNWIELANNSQLANSGNWDTAYGWGDHSTAGYLTAETNDLSSAVTWANVPDANITESSVTQHQAALNITESQISDLSHYTDSSVDTHLNTSSAGTNEVLSWTGTDYDWVAQSTVPLQVIDTKTADYTPTSTDHAKYLRVNSSSTVTITLVNDSTDAIAVGTMFIVGRAGSGSVNISAGSGATIYSIDNALGISPQHGKATVLKVATDTWEVSGNLA